MNLKKMLSKEITSKVKDHISEQTVTEKVDQFFKHGNTFLLMELMNLRREVQSLREELEQQREHKNHNSMSTLIVR
jgi:DNA mismatch repair ATPase MutS